MRVLVTGGGGFVGQWLLRALTRDDQSRHDITVTGRGLSSGTAPNVRVVDVDIREPDRVREVVRQSRPDCIVHLAAVSDVQQARAEPRTAWEVNLLGTMNLAQACLAHVPDCRFLHVSTSEVYGRSLAARTAPADESVLLEPANAYAASKAAADLLIGQLAQDGLRAVRVRPFNHTGPGQGRRFVIPAFAAQIARIERGEQEPVIRVGNLDSERDFLDVRDVVEAYRELIEFAGDLTPGIILNLASGTPRHIGEALQFLLDASQVRVEVRRDEARYRQNEVAFAMGDAGRVRTLVNWAPRVPWHTTLLDTLESWRRCVTST